jgi:putative phage-type endonuclease
MMIIHNVVQGSPEWHALRARHFCASEAPAMMGCSPYQSRTDLLKQKKTGIAPDVDGATQRRFDKGHEAEAAFRPFAEQIIGDDLFPVTGSREVNSLPLLASFDGLTLAHTIGYEHKLYNDSTIDHMQQHGEPPLYHCWQLEHQMLVSGALEILFCCGDGTRENTNVVRYQSKPDRRAQLIRGWKQFAQDLAEHVVPEIVAPVVARPVDALPVVSVTMSGAITVISNLDAFGSQLRAFVERLPARPSTDQEFADAEQGCKILQKAQDALEQAEAAALAQTADIEQMRRTVANYVELARTTRLTLEKVVKARKDQIRVELVQEAETAVARHIGALNERLGRMLMPQIPTPFGAAIRGKKTIDSMREALNIAITQCKLEANAIADRIQINLAKIDAVDAKYAHLLQDLQTLALKQPDDLDAALKARIADYEQRMEREVQERLRRQEEERARTAAAAAATPPAAAPAPTVVQMPTPAPAPAPGAVEHLVKLGDLCTAFGVSFTADTLASLGFHPEKIERASRLYRESQVPAIAEALIQRIRQGIEQRKKAA